MSKMRTPGRTIVQIVSLKEELYMLCIKVQQKISLISLISRIDKSMVVYNGILYSHIPQYGRISETSC